MYGTNNPLSQQSVTIQLNPDGDLFAIQPVLIASNSSAKIPSIATWMEAWNIYLSVRTCVNSSCALELIHYQCIITSANSDHPLTAWFKYDQKFCTNK